MVLLSLIHVIFKAILPHTFSIARSQPYDHKTFDNELVLTLEKNSQ